MLLCSVHFHAHRVNRIRLELGDPRRPYGYAAEHHPLRRAHLLTAWVEKHADWKQRLAHYLDQPWMHNPWKSEALCVHHYEGAWNDSTGNGYYGGLQMDTSFMQTYGPGYVSRYGYANHWPVADQLHAAYRAWLSRGWTPWPNTARMCGLL